jgi:TolB-like protein
MNTAIKNILDELKARKVRKTLAIYVSSALSTIGIIKLFMDVYGLPREVFPIAVTVLTCGIASAFVFAWYHGGLQENPVKKKEVVLQSVFLIVAVAISVRIAGAPRPILLSIDDKSIAVLPFKNMSDNKDDEYFSDGVMEDILTQLCKIGDLKVISRTSVMKYKNTEKTIRDIGEELGVATILEGSVRRSGDRVRIVGQLINAHNDEHVWAETYDREMKDIFAIQSEVAQRIATELKAKLSPDEKQRIEKTLTENIDAYAYYLRGRDYYNHYVKEDNERAIELFKKALELDSTYALAYAGLADAYSQRVQRFSFPEYWADSSIELSKKAIAIDPNIAEPYKALGLAYSQRGWYRKGLDQYYKAVALNPNYAPVVANLGFTNRELGNIQEALPWLRKSIALTPGRASYYYELAMLYLAVASDSIAEHWFRKALELQPDLSYAHVELSKMYLMQGKPELARAQLSDILPKFSDDNYVLTAAGYVELFSGNYQLARKYFEEAIAASSFEAGPSVQLAFTLLKTGHREEGLDMINRSITITQKFLSEGNEDYSLPYVMTSINAIQGKSNEADMWMERAIDGGWVRYRFTLLDPMLANLRDDPRFKEIIGKLKARVNGMRMWVEQQTTTQ